MSSDLAGATRSVSQVLIHETVEQYRLWRNSLSTSSQSANPSQIARGPAAKVGVVPTMGALHQGHMSLIAQARAECDYVVVTIFVNPLQFAPHEDFDKYPRTFEQDRKMCLEAGVDVIFHPHASEIYADYRNNVTTVVPPESLTARLEGSFRPGFFTGVATVVCKLFNIIQPHAAYFGEKDYQQLQVVKRMVRDLNMPISIVPVATMRECDGLAMSSRNVYLTKDQRTLAPVLHETISRVRDEVASGLAVQQIVEAGRASLKSREGIVLQYLEVCHGETLEPIIVAERPFVVLVAAKLGEVRLIDNVVSIEK